MNREITYLVDGIVRYSVNHKISIEKLAPKLTALAKQRLPEYLLASDRESKEHELRSEISKSDSHSLVIRVIMVNWVHEVSWPYFPKFHVIGKPFERYAFPVRGTVENWQPFLPEKTTYIDDLFYDQSAGQFWQPEPYLVGNKISTRTYRHLQSKRLKKLQGTFFRKVNPELVTEVIHGRKEVENYSFRECDDDVIYKSRPYGSRNWRDRISGVQRYWSLKRKSDWK